MVPHAVPKSDFMSKIEKILQKAKISPQSLTITELITLTCAVGFIERQSRSSGKKKGGSHNKIFSHPDHSGVLMNYQNNGSKKSLAKEYQVRQFMQFLDCHPGLVKEIINEK